MRKGKDLDPDPGGPKTNVSYRSRCGPGTLVWNFFTFCSFYSFAPTVVGTSPILFFWYCIKFLRKFASVFLPLSKGGKMWDCRCGILVKGTSSLGRNFSVQRSSNPRYLLMCFLFHFNPSEITQIHVFYFKFSFFVLTLFNKINLKKKNKLPELSAFFLIDFMLLEELGDHTRHGDWGSRNTRGNPG